ncbi:MAG: ATP phosphoribosyltransferase regulatory subunit [Sphaerobacteraceae bacterium]|nr:MAG: ATP phosphoribosyltransferase regulatory subunit [Sphaerobacteraceae bacterium]
MADADPATLRTRQSVQHRLQETFSSHGYQTVDTPVLEHTELFLRKSGGERVAQMYAFNFRDREISLRPEYTASILRYYVESGQSSPLPVRLSYAGPVFRYERPQAGRARQFTDTGVELIGGQGSAADAEIIHLAMEGLSNLGITGKLVLGHIGIVLDFLDRLPLRQRARDWLIWSMERLRKGQPVDVEGELPGLISRDTLPAVFFELSDSLNEIPDDQLERWVLAVLHEVGVQMHGGTRSSEEIVAGVIAKMHQTSEAEDVRRAFMFISELIEVRGTPESVIPELRGLLQRHGLDEGPITEIEMTLKLLDAYGIDTSEVELNLGLGRGLHYYTGILFEIYDPEKPWLQLCGGGRYDELAQSLGARESIPACGFSYGLERIVEAQGSVEAVSAPAVLVVQADSDSAIEAARVAEKLRSENQTVEIDVRGRSVNASRRYAQRRGIARMVIAYADGRVDEETITTKNQTSQPGGEA